MLLYFPLYGDHPISYVAYNCNRASFSKPTASKCAVRLPCCECSSSGIDLRQKNLHVPHPRQVDTIGIGNVPVISLISRLLKNYFAAS